MNRKVFLHTLGCAKNEADSSGMAVLLRKAGWNLSDAAEDSAAIIVNTCGFIDPAVEESVNAIVDACALKQSGVVQKVIVTGCLVSRQYEELKTALPEVDSFLGTAAFHRIVHALQGHAEDNSETKNYLFEVPVEPLPGSSYALVKIGEGCSRSCSFCTIPSFRGGHRSRSIAAVLDDLSRLADAGVSEAILLSQDSTQYGRDLDEQKSLIQLLQAIDKSAHAPERVRLHYTFPDRSLQEIIPVLAQSPRLCSYLDLPLQHTDPTVLRSMQRPDAIAGTLELLQDARSRYPDLWMRTTILIGHPGENENSIEGLIDDIEELAFEYMSLFPWWPEKGTKAVDKGHLPHKKSVQEWLQRVSAAHEEASQIRLGQKLGQIHKVLVDGPAPKEMDDTGRLWIGRTEGQSPDVDGVTFIEGDCVPGMIYRVCLEDLIATDFFAVPAGNPFHILQ